MRTPAAEIQHCEVCASPTRRRASIEGSCFPLCGRCGGKPAGEPITPALAALWRRIDRRGLRDIYAVRLWVEAA